MSNFITFIANFGNTKTGLATVGYVQRGAGGSTVVARTTTGVYEIGGGFYGVEILLENATKSLLWDTGEGSPLFACEDLLDYFNKKALINRRDTNPTDGKQRIFEEDDSATMVEGDIFEDIAGTTPYDGTGTGIDRSDRLA